MIKLPLWYCKTFVISITEPFLKWDSNYTLNVFQGLKFQNKMQTNENDNINYENSQKEKKEKLKHK